MRIAFDAKRAFQNRTGLGHYSRTLISSLAKDFPANEYLLMTPKLTSLFQYRDHSNVRVITPTGFSGLFPSLWRSKGVVKDMSKLNVDLYHGLSHEIPVGIHKTNIRSVVTIHDLIFERFPRQYNRADVAIYHRKCKYACEHAHRVIAISEQTKKDIIAYYGTSASKISVCYQSCNPAFQKTASADEKKAIREKYELPQQFFLYVGSVIERKNLLTICRAIYALKDKLNIPLVVIGSGGGSYMQKVKGYIKAKGLDEKIIFLSEKAGAAGDADPVSSADLPAIYQQALAMIYPSTFEGFGIPVLEALCSRLPVITSNTSCLPETGGNAACYVSPQNVTETADAMYRVATDEELRQQMIAKGLTHAQKFTPEKCAASVMEVYEMAMRN